MRVKVRLFARLRDLAGQDDFEREVPAGGTARDVWDRLATAHPELRPYAGVISCAVNEEYASLDTTLREGDEIAFLPPVSGG